MAAFDVEYDKEMENPATSDCPLNSARYENFLLATEGVLLLGAQADVDASRFTVAIAWVEALVRKAPVPDPIKLSTALLLASSLHLDYLQDQDPFKAAAANVKRIIFGANPVDRHLGAWLVASEVVRQKMEESQKKLAGVKTMKKRLPGLFADQQEAKSSPGLELVERDTGRDKGSGAGKGKPAGCTRRAGASSAPGGGQDGAPDASTATRTKFAETSK